MTWGELDAEARAHMEARADELIAAGMPEAEAWAQARREFGNATLIVESGRDVWRPVWLEQFAQDLRYALRCHLRAPLFTVTAVVSLALGIGANTALFSLANAALFRTLAVDKPGELVELVQTYPGEPRGNGYYTWPAYELFRDHNHVFSAITGFSFDNIARVQLANSDPLRVVRENVTGNYFRFLGVTSALGRMLEPEDVPATGGAKVAVVSWAFWQNQLGADPNAVGRPILVNGDSLKIVGVVPPSYTGPRAELPTAIWAPQEKDSVSILARLKPGVSVHQAQAEVSVLFRQVLEERWRAKKDPQLLRMTMEVLPASAGLSRLRDQYGKPLLLLLASVGLLLLLACLNLAGLLMARNSARQGEMAVRSGLGAGRSRLARQMLTESLVLSLAGAALAAPIAIWGARVVSSIMATGREHEQIRLTVPFDGTVLAFGLALTFATAMLFGLAPALTVHHASTGGLLRQSASLAHRRAQKWLGKGLVAIQVGLSLALLTVATLCLDELWRLRNLGLGFERNGVLLTTVDPTGSGQTRAQLAQKYRQLLARLHELPGVRSASATACTPIEGCGMSRFVHVPGIEESPGDRRWTALSFVAPRYFETLGIPLVAGRDFTLADAVRPRVAIINETLARRYFPKGDALGKYIGIEINPQTGGWHGDSSPYEVVGIAGDTKTIELREDRSQQMYFNMFQEDRIAGQFVIKTAVPPQSLARDVRRTMREVLGPLPVMRSITLAAQVDAAMVPERLMAALSSVFGGLGALIAAVGILGLLSYLVERRSAEIGIRMALGATRANVLRAIATEACVLLGVGLSLGAMLSYLAAPLVRQRMGFTNAATTAPLLAAGALLLLIGLLAAAIPARRAALIDPASALRTE